jgi:hypothetical protein
MVMNEPVLLSACLAYASHVLFLHDRVSIQTKEDLHDQALRQLIPRVSSYREENIDCDLGPILATTVILRMTEQFLELGDDRQHHLYGSSTLFETGYHERSFSSHSPSSTSFWAYLRGSIRISFLLEKPCPSNLDRNDVWKHASEETMLTDDARANVMTYLMAELCTTCWGEPTSQAATVSNMNHLEHAVSEWKRHLPATFQPWYSRWNESDTFPDVRYLAPWHCKLTIT